LGKRIRLKTIIYPDKLMLSKQPRAIGEAQNPSHQKA